MHHQIFHGFKTVPSISTGTHMYDFLGTRTRLSFRRGWDKFAIAPGKEVAPGYPPANEHYFDWIATLTAVSRARGTFRMAELGAGWAPWLVRGAFAARQNPQVMQVELLGIDADPTHFRWANEHFSDNGLIPNDHHILFGAVSSQPGPLKFPAVSDPDQDYGASLRAAQANIPHIEVPAYSMKAIVDRFSGGPIDLVHVDIQGAEYDALPDSMGVLARHVKSIMIGTHLANDSHDGLAQSFRDAGWREVMNFERNSLAQTEFGDVQFGDGFLLYDNPALV